MKFLWRGYPKLITQTNKKFQLFVSFFSVQHFPSDMLYKLSIFKLNIFSSMCDCKSCADDFPQIVWNQFVISLINFCLLKTFDTIWLRTENLFYPFSVLSVWRTTFLFACGKLKTTTDHYFIISNISCC